MINCLPNIFVKSMVSLYLFQSEIYNVTPERNNINKSIRVNLVKDIVTQLIESKIKNDGRVSHGEVHKHLDDAKRICSIISRYMINRAMQLHWSTLFSEDDEYRLVSNENESENENERCDNSRQKGGRVIEISIVYKYESELCRVKLHNNVSMKYILEKKFLPCGEYYLKVVWKKS